MLKYTKVILKVEFCDRGNPNGIVCIDIQQILCVYSERREKMKSTGIVRKVDNLGRIVIPKEIRRTFEIDLDDDIEIYVEGDKIILKKRGLSCVFCGSEKDIFMFKGKNICSLCIKEMQRS